METYNAVILFDGWCVLCTGAVGFVMKRDKKRHFRFASLDSEFAKGLLAAENLQTISADTFLLFENGKLFDRSTAALRVSKKLDGAWPFLYCLMIIPRFIRDGIYSVVARNRYRWFGRRNSCFIPSPEDFPRFPDYPTKASG